MDRRLVDTSTLFDVQRSPNRSRAEWARTTLRHYGAYRAAHSRLTISALTLFEALEGFYRNGRLDAVRDMTAQLAGDFEVIYPDEAITILGAEIHAALAKGQTIGVADTLIAATAISRGLTLVTANAGHFARVQAAGFPLVTENWREPGPFPRV